MRIPGIAQVVNAGSTWVVSDHSEAWFQAQKLGSPKRVSVGCHYGLSQFWLEVQLGSNQSDGLALNCGAMQHASLQNPKEIDCQHQTWSNVMTCAP